MRGDRIAGKVGPLLREWRTRRRLSQLDLALRVGISARHLSFVETGRARPSRELLLRLAEHLDVPARQRNSLLLAAGFAPVYEESPLVDPSMQAVYQGIRRLVHSGEPFPTFVVDAGKNVVMANRGTEVLLDGITPALLDPPMNIMRLALHPDGMIGRVTNPAEWRTHLLTRLRREAIFTGDERLSALYAEVSGYGHAVEQMNHRQAADHILAPLRIRALGAELGLLNVVTTFGTPVDITLAELSIETFYPADATTAALLHDRHRAATEHSSLIPG